MTPTPDRADLAAGVVLVACFYGIKWMVKRLPKTRVEIVAADLRRTGQATRIGLVGLARAALAEGELLDRIQRT